MRLSLAVAVLLWSTSLFSQPLECGNSPEHDRFMRASADFLELRAARMASKGVPFAANATLSGNIFVVRADDTNAPYRHPFDLESKTLELTPAGEDAFVAHVGPLEWAGDRGRELMGTESRTWDLLKPFTIFGRSVQKLYVTERNSIHLDPPMMPTANQYGDFELASFSQAVIAPLLLTDALLEWVDPKIYIRELPDALQVTWEDSGGSYSLQATIFADGRIRLSYQNVALPAGGVLVTTGSEGWREQRTPLMDVADAAGDVPADTPADLRGMLDIASVTVNRLADLDLAEVRITLAERPVFHHVETWSWVSWNVVIGTDPFSSAAARVVMYGTGPELRVAIPVFGGAIGSPAAALDDRTVIVRLPDEFLDVANDVTVVSRIEDRNVDVVASRPLALPEPARHMRADLSAADGATVRMPVVEAFTMPVLAPQRVWDQIRLDYGLHGDNVDGVAIYQTFATDIQLYAGAYSTVGNAGASGIEPGDESAPGRPKSPALLHMNELSLTGSDRNASHVLLHEFGHHWLYFLALMENGAPRYALNPLRAHPAQFVHTPAAFNVYANDDSSVMGGGNFRDNGDGTFTSGSGAHNGYSWLDLYLMGLASPEEVAPLFYIADSFPKLADAYYAPKNYTVKGTRRNATVQQVIDGTGPRLPVAAQSQKEFRVAFVLVADGEPSQAQLDRMNYLRELMVRDFRTATGGRASLSTTFTAPVPPPSGPRRRAVRK